MTTLQDDKMNFQNAPVVLITGASSGIGSALAHLYFKQGYRLILMARRETELKQLKSDLLQQQMQNDESVLIVPSDVTQFEVHQTQVKDSINKMGRIDIAIANAGVGFNTNEKQNTFVATKKTFEVNLLGAVATLEAAKEFMLKQGFGKLVGVTSVAASRGLSLSSAYCSSKAALATFLESMRIDLQNTKLNVIAIHPGFVATPMTEKNGPMPFLLTADVAAKKVFNAIQKNKARFTFPWPMAFLTLALRLLPNMLYDFLMKRMHKRAEVFKANRAKG